MRAMLLDQLVDLSDNSEPLRLANLPVPDPKEGEILIKVKACGVCHTELDEIEGRTPPRHFPIILGHQVTGIVEKLGPNTKRFSIGDRIGVAWVFSTCGKCQYCLSDQENLCPEFQATGRDANGGYAEYMIAKEDFAYLLPDNLDFIHSAPLLCAGAIGYRSFRLANLTNGKILGLSGFGASAHLVLKLVKYLFPDTPIFVFARSEKERQFAITLGAHWAGDYNETPPSFMDSIIDTTPVWGTIVSVLKWLKPGGRLVINAIRKESVDKNALLELDYARDLWLEKEIKSVANVTRRDVQEFLDLAGKIPITPEVEVFPLEEANTALLQLKNRQIRGAKVLVMD